MAKKCARSPLSPWRKWRPPACQHLWGGSGSLLTLEQFADASDVVDVTARDITNDGKAEVIVRGVIRALAPKEAGLKKGTVIDREVMLVYAVTR